MRIHFMWGLRKRVPASLQEFNPGEETTAVSQLCHGSSRDFPGTLDMPGWAFLVSGPSEVTGVLSSAEPLFAPREPLMYQLS